MPFSGAWNLDEQLFEGNFDIFMDLRKYKWKEKCEELMIDAWVLTQILDGTKIPDYDRPGCLMSVLTIWNCFKLTRNYCNQFVILSRDLSVSVVMWGSPEHQWAKDMLNDKW